MSAALSENPEMLEREFATLVDRWHQETAFFSDVRMICMHPAYQRIIGMGRPALPLIFERMAHEPDHWFWALNAIVGVDIAAGESNMRKASEQWLQWARTNRFLPQ